jgi:hypothetical protein
LLSIFSVVARYEMLVVVLVALCAGFVGAFDSSAWTRFADLADRIGKGWRAPAIAIAFALLLRASLLPVIGIPTPQVHDEFSYLLMGDTFAHLRLTNPTPPSWQHFETFHENMVPTYHSKYPIAQGVALAVGEKIVGEPWFGVYLASALMAGAICWAIGAFVPASWALFGGLLCALRLCAFGYWVNSYWGGPVTALGGALVLGAGARMLSSEDRVRAMLGFVFGVGLLTLFFSRPLEGFLFALPILIAVTIGMMRRSKSSEERRNWLHPFLACTAVIIAGLLFFFYYNHRTTGNALVMPYFVYERAYASAPLLVLSKLAELPHYNHGVMEAFYQNWRLHASLYSDPAILLHFEKVRYVLLWKFFAGWMLTLPIAVGAVAMWRRSRGRVVLLSVVIPLLGYGIVLAFHPHYFAAATASVFVLVVAGLRSLWMSKWKWIRALAGALGLASIVFVFGEPVSSIYIFRAPTTRQKVAAALNNQPGQHLVLVNFLNGHAIDTDVVFNGADFPSEKILWARKMWPAKDAELCTAFPGRQFWDLETNDETVSLKPSTLCRTQH